MRFRVTNDDGVSVEVEAVDWMMAMAKAVQQMGIEVSGWICDNRPDGDTFVTDTATGRGWLVHPIGGTQRVAAPPLAKPGAPPPVPAFLQNASGFVKPQALQTPPAGAKAPPPPPPVMAPPPAPAPPAAKAPPPAAPAPVAAKPAAPPPAPKAEAPRPAPPKTGLWENPRSAPAPAPAPARKEEGPPADLAERLFDVSMDIAGAEDANAACSVALEIALGLVPCEAGSVLRGGLNEANLRFVAVSGPAADQLLGRAVPFGQGIVGACFDLGITIQVNDVTRDERHLGEIDAETGFRTRSVLCVPVRTVDQFFGCVQLLNPPGRFLPWHVEVAETVARSLAAALAVTL